MDIDIDMVPVGEGEGMGISVGMGMSIDMVLDISMMLLRARRPRDWLKSGLLAGISEWRWINLVSSKYYQTHAARLAAFYLEDFTPAFEFRKSHRRGAAQNLP